MIASMLESLGEAYAVLRKAGVAPHLFLDVINSVFNSPVYANYGGIVADERFEPAGFALRLGLKDIRLALETSGELTAPWPIANIIRDHMLQAMAQGQGEMDWCSVAKVSARNAGL
jgi:3-hydroxyisobutyrate dehydrogenase-like beta-hydroxyacid dehydrogenase